MNSAILTEVCKVNALVLDNLYLSAHRKKPKRIKDETRKSFQLVEKMAYLENASSQKF